MLGFSSLFDGNPTAVMYRSEIVRAKAPFFNDSKLFEDVDVCFEILLDWDFAFVPEILSRIRVENESIMSRIRRTDPSWHLGLALRLLQTYGDRVMSRDEAASAVSKTRTEYCVSMGEAMFNGAANASYWALHERLQRDAGIAIGLREVLYLYLRDKCEWRHPLTTLGRIWRLLGRRLSPGRRGGLP